MKHAEVVAKAVLQAEDGTILLLRRSNTDTRRPLQWDLPGGMVEDDEDFLTACAREITEEAGIAVGQHKLHLAYTESLAVDGRGVCWLFFVATVSKQDPVLSFEHDTFQWVSLGDALKDMQYDRHIRALTHIKEAKILQ